MWVQHETDKPEWFPIRDKKKAELIVQAGTFTMNNKKYSVIGVGGKNDLDAILQVFYKEDTWKHYNDLKLKVKRFKQTGIWE